MCNALILLPIIAGLGCNGGDFGRTRDTFYHQDMHKWVGAEATESLGGRPSQFQLTDLERQLRDLAYYFIQPPHSRPAWKAVFGDYQVIPSPWRQTVVFDPTAYGRRMINEPHRSQASAYGGLIEDVRNDFTMLDQFVPVAMKVNDLDIKRQEAMKYVSALSPREYDDAQARMRENVLVVQWTQQVLEQRVASYRWALERLAIHAPDPMAADADRLIRELASRAASAWTSAPPVVGKVLRVGG
ncbi:hypothetical protein ASC80_21250 [Afipia sp. Root123D2]|jgi:hypothetical protein|uniref:hypothetical protein n=1 Tax=Afipia sp. Root123D2 TaxID=1736436 RepID=UPI000701BD47|nr:hypothetical protein [Afipia sp. Root123D2]KQW18536.1 hypothetical protein ASC80_21250 [Afipia sp. Root123D2]